MLELAEEFRTIRTIGHSPVGIGRDEPRLPIAPHPSHREPRWPGGPSRPSGEELFGNHTVPSALNGFEALARMDYELSGIVRTAIHPGDALFDQLLLWIDRNHNGISEPDELVRAGDVLSEISFQYEPSQRRDQFGNLYRFEEHDLRANNLSIR
jgi:hypothetical protein